MTYTTDFATQLAINTAPGRHYADSWRAARGLGNLPVRLIAFYLPQFHPIPENDLWWGEGFSEWTNVTKSRPQFHGHYQPQLPTDLGFYDLRVPDTLREQAALARKYGIYGFCFYHYWFGGKQLLETPLNLLLAHPNIDLPFCICWANENWTRRWDGLENEVLVAQQHSPEDDIAFARSLEAALHDPRYIRVNGRPLILLYRPELLPNALATARRWRVHFARSGLGDPYLVMAQAFNDHDPRIYGFDAAVEIPPHKVGFGGPTINSEMTFFNPAYRGTIYDYEDMVRRASILAHPPYKLFRGVCPGWDNEPRKPGCGHVFAYSTPEKYAQWLENACGEALRAEDASERLVFINAWNEWAEGAHLEPDRHFGHAYLQATARVLAKINLGRLSTPRQRIVLVSHDAQLHGAQMIALHIVRALVRDFGIDVHVLLGGPGQLEQAFRQAAPTERIDSGFGDATAWHRIAQRLRAQGFMIAWCNTLVSAQAMEPLRSAGLQVVSLVHELPGVIRSYGLLNTARTVAQHADAVVFPSAYVRDRFIELAGPLVRGSVICPQGVYLVPASEPHRSIQRWATRELLTARPADRVILGVGYGDRRKGLDLWPELISLVVARCPEALFVWVGRVENNLLARMKGELERAGLSGRFRLPGPSETMQHMYAAADLFALTSREDPFPSVVLEAMAHGLPVISFENSGGFTGLLREASASVVPYLDIKAMADELCRLLRDDGAREEIGKKERQRIERDFTFDAYISDLLRVASNVQPTVSVVVPNYNYARYLRQRLNSIWSQTYPIHEVILLDDASTDDSNAVINELQGESDGRLRVIRNTANSGSVSRQWALGTRLSTGDLVWIAEADDFAEPGFLAATVRAFVDARTVLSYCQSRQIDDAGSVLAEHYLDYVTDVDADLWRCDYHRPGMTEISEALSVKNTIPNVSAVLFRHSALVQVLDSYMEEMAAYRNTADWCCYIRLLVNGWVAFTATTLNNHRRHTSSVTLAKVDRRHLREIAAMQALASSIAPVSSKSRGMAGRWYEAVATQFGITESLIRPDLDADRAA